MIRIVTDKAMDEWLARHREALAIQIASAVGALLPEDCTHRDRPSCPRCAERRTVLKAADVVRETGGVQ